MNEFVKRALAAGFTPTQAQFMRSYLSKPGHTHQIDDVEGLEEALELQEEELEEDEEDEG